MRYIVTRTKDGTGWQTTGREEFRDRPYLQMHGAKKMHIVAEADTWEEARALMQKLRDEDYRDHLKRRARLRMALIAVFIAGLWLARSLVY